MASDRGPVPEALSEHVAALRARVDERLAAVPGDAPENETPEDVEGPRKPPSEPRVVTGDGPGPGLASTVRACAAGATRRAKAFYAHAFLPTNDDFAAVDPDDAEFGGFDFAGWLEAGATAGPEAPPSAPRVVTDAPAPAADDADGFDFGEWLAAGEGFDPTEPAEPAVEEAPPVPDAGPSLRPHPAKAATYALFLALAALAALSVAGLLPTLGPAVGLVP